MTRGRDIFVDTSAFIAMRVKDDVNHGKAHDFFTTIREKKLRLHTTNFVLDEVYTYVCRNHDIAIEMVQLIMNNPLIILHRVDVDDENNGVKILRNFVDKDFSYTDAASFAVMERLGIKTVFCFDNHFEPYGKFSVVP